MLPVAAGSRLRRAVRTAILLATGLATSCATIDRIVAPSTPAGTPGNVTGFLGGVVADEPLAVLAARAVLSSGGNAADAAVALGFALSVTLPSRVGLGGGGGCLAYAADRKSVNQGVPEAVLFVPAAPPGGSAGSDRPAALPMLARGLFALHARYGSRPFDSLIAPAERMARFGVPVSRALVADLTVVAGPLGADPGAAGVFLRNGAPLREGDDLVQTDLGATLSQLRTAGVGDMYQGLLARRIDAGSRLAGGAMSQADLRAALPTVRPALTLPAGRDMAAFLPPPADGGLAAAAAFAALAASPADAAGAQARGLAVAAQFRVVGGDPQAALTAPAPPAALPPLPASSGFATLDKDGNAVVCAVTLNNLFGTGRMVPGIGFLLAASPAATPPPLLAAGLVWNANIHAFRAAVAGSGQDGAPLAVALGLRQTLDTQVPMPSPVPEPGRANVIACSRYLPDAEGSCGWATDPRGAGLAAGSN